MCVDIDKSEIEDSTTIVTQGDIPDKDEDNLYPNAKNPKYTLYDNGHLDIWGGVFRTNQSIIRLEAYFEKNYNVKLRSITIGSSLLPEDRVVIANVRDIFKFQSPSVTKIKLGNVNVSEIRDMSWMFSLNYCLESLDLGDNFSTSQVSNMQAMFAGLSELKKLNLGNNFDTANVTDMSSMFEGLSNLKQLDLGYKFDTSNVLNMSAMFAGMESLERLDLGNLFNTSKVSNMSALFADVKSIKTLDLGDLFSTSKVTNMRQMFLGLSSIVNLDLGDNFDTSNVIDMNSMFKGMEKLETLDLGDNFDTSKVETVEMMFEGNRSLKKLDLKEKFFFNESLNNDGMFKGAHFKEFIISNPIYNFNRTGLDTNIISSEYGTGWVMRENPRIKYKGNDEFMSGYDPYNPNHLGTYVKPKTSYVSYSNDPSGTGKYNFGDVFRIRTARVYPDDIFTGWYYNGKNYFENQEFIMPEHNVYFHAGYTAKTYKVSFVNKEGYRLLNSLIKSLDDKVTLLEGPALKGHTFRSWTYKDREYFEGDIHLVEREDITFVANYDVNKYDVSFIDVDGNSLFNSLNLDYGTKFTLPNPELIKGYTFKGWISDGVLYNADETLELSDSDKSFTAIYEINKYEVNFINESNIKLLDSLNLDYGSEFSLPDFKVVKGYTFKAWKKNDLMYNPGDSITLSDSDLSFVGVYEVNQYDVSFVNKDNEKLFETLSLDYGSEYTLPNPEQIKGYTFVGWLSEDIIYSANTKVTLSDSNRVYTAVYEKVKPNDSSDQVIKESSSKVVDTGISDISGLLVIVISVLVLSIVLLKRRKVRK